MMEKIGIIGYGNMGKTIAERIRENYTVCVFDKDKNKVSGLKNIAVADNPADLVKQSEIIILAVKPQDFDVLLNEIKSFTQDKLIVTIAAGITTGYIKSRLGEETRIIRVIPNMPAQINQGVSVLFKGKNATALEFNSDWQLAWQIFSYFGLELAVDNEEMINAATAISGSGPAFFCYYIKAKANAQNKREEFIKMLADAAVNLGFDRGEAKVLSQGTVDGIIAMLIQKNLSCEDIIKMVASKGGTTQAGLEVLEAGGTLDEAVKKAKERADELGQSLPTGRQGA